MRIGQVWSLLKGVPGVVAAIVAALIALQLYIHARERTAVERAQWHQQLDSLSKTHTADSVAAAARDAARVDSIRRWQSEAARIRHSAAEQATHFASVEEVMRAAIDSADTAEQAAFDTLIAAHQAEVLSLRRALAYADSIHAVDSLRVADRDGQLQHLRSDLAAMTAQAIKFEKASHPGWLAGIFKSPWTHIAAAGAGYLLGRR